jgi:hypothetical protein
MEQITGTVNSFSAIPWKIQWAIELNEFDLKTLVQIDFAHLNHDPKR